MGSSPVTIPRMNWAGNVIFGAKKVAQPTNVGEVRTLLAEAQAASLPVSAVGTAHSFSGVADDGTGNAGAVRVEPGVRHGDLGAFLHSQARSLADLASLPHLSVAGAVLTGTHGSGDRNGSLATAVRSIELMAAGGDIVTIDRGDPDFDGAVVSLGALGLVVGLTLDTMPTFDIAQTVFLDLPLNAGIEPFDALMGSAYSVSWFTNWRDGRIDQVWRKSVADPVADLTALGAKPAPGPVHPVPGLDPAACTTQLGVAGPWHRRLPHFRFEHVPSAGDELQTELFVDRSTIVEALVAMGAVGQDRREALLVSEVRTVAADSLWLSPAYQRDVVGLHFTWRSDWRVVEPALARDRSFLTESHEHTVVHEVGQSNYGLTLGERVHAARWRTRISAGLRPPRCRWCRCVCVASSGTRRRKGC